MSDGDCGKCERLLQGYLDRELTTHEVAEAEEHLNGCDYSRRRGVARGRDAPLRL